MLFHWSLNDSKFPLVSKNTSKYPSRFLQCCGLDGFDFSFNLQLIQSLYQVLGDCSKWLQLWLTSLSPSCSTTFQLCSKIQIFVVLFAFLHIHSVVCWHSIIIITVTPWEFFTSVLADSLSLEFELQQVFSSFQDSSQYSGQSQ